MHEISATYSAAPRAGQEQPTKIGRSASSPPADISRLNMAFMPLFPYSVWRDINRDARIQLEEISPPLRSGYAQLLNRIDLNGDGVCYEEMRSYMSAGYEIDPDRNISVIYDDLVSKGAHQLEDAPVLIVMDDMVPEDILKMPFYSKAASLIKRGSIITYGISRDGSFSSSPTYEGAKKFVLIVFPKDKTLSLSRLYVESMISHELVHARQYISGKRMEFDSIYYFMHASGKFSEEEIRTVSASLPAALGEIEAYRHEMVNALPQGDLSRLQYFAIYLNSQMSDVERAVDMFKSKNAEGLVMLAASMLDEVMSNETAAMINGRIKSLADSRGETDPVLVRRAIVP